jgi:hypothetical protein
MRNRHVIVLRPHPDAKGDAYLHMPPIEEGPYILPYETARALVWERLKRVGEPFTLLEDFTAIRQWHADRRLPFDIEGLDIWSRPHDPAIHVSGSFCSNCDVEDLSEVLWEPEDDGDATDHPSADDPFAEDRAEALAERNPGLTIENHDECANCGRDFILTKQQSVAWITGTLELSELLCEDCRRHVTGQ